MLWKTVEKKLTKNKENLNSRKKTKAKTTTKQTDNKLNMLEWLQKIWNNLHIDQIKFTC